ncbi:hypothetical protein KM043_015105 [Ampulex compressa]|nr:hypothetical protein KM043_015105 [Ampulex compressa]
MRVTRTILGRLSDVRKDSAVCPKILSLVSPIAERESKSSLCSTRRKCWSVKRERNYGTSATTTVTSAVLQEMPEPRGLPVFGTLLSLAASGGAKHLHEYVEKRHKELGPVYRERIGPVKAVFVNSPCEFRRIFRLEGPTPKHFLPDAWVLYNELRNRRRGVLFMDGEEWLRCRRILNKVMLVPDPTQLMVGPCQEAAETLVENWKIQTRSNPFVPDLEKQLYQWSIEVMLATLMGSSWQTCKDRLLRDSKGLAEVLHKIFEYSAHLSMVPAKLAMNLKMSPWTNFVTSVDTALEVVQNLVSEMARIGGNGLLMRMQEEGIRDEDLGRIVMDFILAAGDTTASSMQWALFLLSSHPECQERLLASVEELSPRDVLRNSLLRGIIKETLRMYPVAPFITRYLPEDSLIGGYVVPKGELLLLSIYSSGRDEANFPRPNEFHPERWTRTEEGIYRGVTYPHASLPFALGARSCIGRKLAEIQMSLALVQLVKTFRIECTNTDRVKMILHLISVPSESIQLRLTRRYP